MSVVTTPQVGVAVSQAGGLMTRDWYRWARDVSQRIGGVDSETLTEVIARLDAAVARLDAITGDIGTATLDFGAAPGSNVATVTVTGQTRIDAGSQATAALMGDTTADHNAYEHLIVPLTVRCSDIVAGTGFTITASSEWRLTGTFKVRWSWT